MAQRPEPQPEIRPRQGPPNRDLAGAVPGSPGRGIVVVGLAAALLIYLLDLATRNTPVPALWSPTAGLGLVLVAWLGYRFGAAVLFAGGVLLLGHAAMVGLAGVGDEPFSASLLLLLGLRPLLDVLEPAAAWWLYHERSHGSRRLADPRSATLFVFLVPGVAAGVSALLRVALFLALQSSWLSALGSGEGSLPITTPGAIGFWRLLALFWLDRALGMLIVAPPLLVIVTPWLIRRGLIQGEQLYDQQGEWDRNAVAAVSGESRWGDHIEILGLALSASILCLMLSNLQAQRELLGWQLWGVQILLIVWASLRQGLPGGTLVAAAAAAAPLTVRSWWQPDGQSTQQDLFVPLVQAHLLAQCAAAVLVAAAASWVRMQENGYRQIVGHIPVVIYSARLLPGARSQEAGARTQGSATGPSVTPDSRPLTPGLLAEVTLVSAASTRLLGCPADQLLGDYRRWLSLVHPDDHEVVIAAVEQLTRQEQPVTCEYRLLGNGPGGGSDPEPKPLRGFDPGSGSMSSLDFASSRKVRWLRDTLAPHRDVDGRLLGWDGVLCDITEQRALADDLRRTTSMFNALVSNLPTGVFFIQGPHGQPILVNARARQLLGQREDSSAGLEYLPRVYRLFRPDGTLYPAEELPVYLALRQGRTTMRDDIVVHRPDGRRVPLVTWAAPVQLNGRGGPDAAVWVLEDLTALHQAEAARKDSEGRLRAVIETMAEGLLVHDARGVIVNCNPAACAFFGRQIEQLRDRSLFDLDWRFVREDGTPLSADGHPFQIVLRTGHPVRNFVLGVHPAEFKGEQSEYAGRKPLSCDGPLMRWLLVNAMPLAPGEAVGRQPSQANIPPAVVTTFSDISAYIHAREAIRSSEERYRGLVETLPLMVVQSDRNLRLTYVNPATQAITGYSLQEISDPTAWASMIHPEDLPRAYELSRNALAGQSDRGELRYRAKDNSEKVAYVLSQPRQQDGVIIGATTLLVDITRERHLERELQRAQRLELIGRLSSGIAHDFNNLLGVVLNLTDLARGHLPSDHPVHADLKRIAEAGEQAAGLAAQLLAFSKQRPAVARRVEINAVTRRTLELLKATLPASICIEADLAPGEAAIRADETQVQQVLMNLCLNARDAMPQGGTLLVTTFQEPASEGMGARVRLSVADSGKGMSDEVRGRIFEPFFSTREGGTGLGLAVVQQIVESYGGTVDVQSQPDKGSRFDIRWPVAP